MSLAGPNNPQILSRYEQWLTSRADANMREALEEFQLALQSGAIELPAPTTTPPVYAGGMNYCPNSDVKFSKLAIDSPGSLPTDPGDDNQEASRFYRQIKDADIDLAATGRLKADAHSLFAATEGTDANIPIWDRINGYAIAGSVTGDLWDIAINLYNNDVKPGDRWYVQMVLGATGVDLVPEDLEMYVGFWHIPTKGPEGWITGGQFALTYEIPPGSIKGTQEFNYVAVATTDGGVTLYSQVLNVTDAPNALSGLNVVRLNYGSVVGAGFVEFKIYRETVATGEVHEIARLRNVNNILFDDDGGNIGAVNALPSGSSVNEQALAYSRNLQVGTFGGDLLINNFTIQIPSDYDWSGTQAFSQFLRFGFTTHTAIAAQVRIDRIYCGPTFNKWSDSPFDPKDSIPSTSQTGGLGSGGGIGGPPDPGGGCLRHDVPVLARDFDRERKWTPYAEVPQGELLDNGERANNVVKKPLPTRTRFSFRIDFSNGVHIYCTRPHHLIINEHDDHEAALRLEVGDTVWGLTNGVEGPVTIISKILLASKDEEEFGTFELTGERGDGDHRYVAGFSQDGNSGVFHRNRKGDPVL